MPTSRGRGTPRQLRAGSKHPRQRPPTRPKVGPGGEGIPRASIEPSIGNYNKELPRMAKGGTIRANKSTSKKATKRGKR